MRPLSDNIRTTTITLRPMLDSDQEHEQPAAALAVCICTRNRPESLRVTLSAVLASTLRPDQIVVSDDSDAGSLDRNRSICMAVPGMVYCTGPRQGLAANRNNCITHLADPIRFVSFIDDDLCVRPNFFREAQAAILSHPEHTIVTGQEVRFGFLIEPHNPSFWGYQNVPASNSRDHHTIVINTTLFPRTLFKSVRFDNHLRYGSDEIDISGQAEYSGFVIMFVPSLINDHYPSPINREEYSIHQEVSRLYTTYKRYRWLQARPGKAALYALLSPMHLFFGVIKRRDFRRIPHTLMIVVTAAHYILKYQHTIGKN